MADPTWPDQPEQQKIDPTQPGSKFFDPVPLLVSDAEVLRERVSQDANPAMTLAIKKRSNTELFIDRMGVLHVEDGRIKEENVVMVVNHWCWLICGSSLPYVKSTKKCKNVKPGSSLFQNEFNGNMKENWAPMLIYCKKIEKGKLGLNTYYDMMPFNL